MGKSRMLIAPPCVVTLTWTLTDAQNRPIDALDTPTEFLFGGSDLLAGIEPPSKDHLQTLKSLWEEELRGTGIRVNAR